MLKANFSGHNQIGMGHCPQNLTSGYGPGSDRCSFFLSDDIYDGCCWKKSNQVLRRPSVGHVVDAKLQRQLCLKCSGRS